LALFALAGACATTPALGRANEETRNFLRLTGSADWELFRSDGTSGSTRSTFNAFRQRYGVDLAGSIWDYRFNRFLVGLDLFRDDRGVDGRSEDSTHFGYRAEGTFFPSRPFPLRLFARRSTIDYTGFGLGSGDRETAAWGVEWNLASTSQHSGSLSATPASRGVISRSATGPASTTVRCCCSTAFARRPTPGSAPASWTS
jgi:hypothetical protein